MFERNNSKSIKKGLFHSNSQLLHERDSTNNLLLNTEESEDFAIEKPVYFSCLDIECESGGVCITDESHSDKRIRCRCPIGRGGFFCEKRKFRRHKSNTM